MFLNWLFVALPYQPNNIGRNLVMTAPYRTSGVNVKCCISRTITNSLTLTAAKQVWIPSQQNLGKTLASLLSWRYETSYSALCSSALQWWKGTFVGTWCPKFVFLCQKILIWKMHQQQREHLYCYLQKPLSPQQCKICIFCSCICITTFRKKCLHFFQIRTFLIKTHKKRREIKAVLEKFSQFDIISTCSLCSFKLNTKNERERESILYGFLSPRHLL